LPTANEPEEKKLETFCFRAPGHIFSPKKVDDFTIFCPAKDALQEFTMKLSGKMPALVWECPGWMMFGFRI